MPNKPVDDAQLSVRDMPFCTFIQISRLRETMIPVIGSATFQKFMGKLNTARMFGAAAVTPNSKLPFSDMLLFNR